MTDGPPWLAVVPRYQYSWVDDVTVDGLVDDPAGEWVKLADVITAFQEQLVCGGCGGPHQFDTSVPSVLWNRVVRPVGGSEYLCASCVLKAFTRAGVSFTAELYGDGFSGLPIAIEVNGAASTAARELSDQNNQLRAALSAILDHTRDALDLVTKVVK